ncbi:MAG: hypothetical protein JOZ63_08015 [Planctomycetaceae bacterium]|nr:hypothetical protein [Planctomycetaceae bacterium]MBV8382537.1 hypothetical protein [Planctomycetaceae bacterium]
MAGKPLNRLELRRQNEAAEPLDPMEDESEDLVEDIEDEEGEVRRVKKKKAPAKKAKAAKPAKPAARLRIVWVVMNDAFKPVGTFEYSQKEAAEARAAELTAKGKGTHFVQKVKEPMPDNAPGLGAAIPRPAVTASPVAVKETPAIEEEDELEEEEDAEPEVDEEEIEDED